MTFKVKSGIRVNTVDVIDQYGNFTGNAFLGSTPVAVNKGGTGADNAPNARINLFGDISPDGLLVKTGSGVFSTSIVGGTGIVVDDGDGVSGSPTISLDANANVTFQDVNVTGSLYSNDITAENITAQGDLRVTGNLIIDGETTTVNTQEVLVEDNEIILNANVTGAPLLDAYVTVNRGSEYPANVRWNESVDRWQFTNDGVNYYNIPTPDEYDNVIYSVSIQDSDTPFNGANLRLTGSKAGNTYITDEVKLIGSGLVTVTRQDNDTLVINAGGSLVTSVTGILDSQANVIDLFSKDLFISVEYFYTAIDEDNLKVSSGKIMVIHDDNATTYNNQYGILQTDPNDEVVILTTDISEGNVRLLAQSTSGHTSTVKLTGTVRTPF